MRPAHRGNARPTEATPTEAANEIVRTVTLVESKHAQLTIANADRLERVRSTGGQARRRSRATDNGSASTRVLWPREGAAQQTEMTIRQDRTDIERSRSKGQAAEALDMTSEWSQPVPKETGDDRRRAGSGAGALRRWLRQTAASRAARMLTRRARESWEEGRTGTPAA